MVKIREASAQDLPKIIELWQRAELIYKPKGRDRIEHLKK